MKLLFDHNLSPRLVGSLSDAYPSSEHVSLVGLDRASDEAVWDHARDNGNAIVTKDADFDELSQVRESPPKVIWLRLGNCTTRQIETALRSQRQAVEALDADPNASVLELG